MNPAYDSALRLAEAGFAVYAATAQKRPCAGLDGWNHDAAATNADQVQRMWRQYPDAPAVGIACEPSHIVAVDFDSQNDKGESIGRWLLDYGDDWQRTICTLTPSGGRHYYFRQGGKRSAPQALHLMDGALDCISTTGVIAPASTATNGSYVWAEGCSPWERPIAPMPDWLPERIAREQQILREKKHGAKAEKWEKTEKTPSQEIVSPDLVSFSSSLGPDVLAEIVRDEQIALFLARWLGCDVRAVGTPFLCPLHRERKPSANLFRHASGVILLHDWHLAGQKTEWLSLAEVYAAKISGIVEKLPKPSHATWERRLLVDAGLAPVVDVAMKSLPASASRVTRSIYHGIRHLFACRWLGEPGVASPLTWNFIAKWCDCTRRTAAKNLEYLEEQGIIVPAGFHCTQAGKKITTYGKETRLYLPVAPTPDPAAAARRAGQIGKTLYGVSQYDTNPPWFAKDSMKETLK